MKKFLASIIALAAMTAAFTGCTEVNDGASGSSENSGANSSQQGNAQQRSAADLGYAAANCLEWVSMQQVTDAENAMTMFGIDTSLCEQYYLSVAMMSAHLNEIIIVKPKAGSEPAVQAQLDEHFNYIRESAAFYPAQQISAEGAVKGKTADGYSYIIVHQIGQEIADVMDSYYPGSELTKLEVPEPEVSGSEDIELPPEYFGEPSGENGAAGGENQISTVQ